MTYFADGTPYEFLAEAAEPGAINVGWLDAAHPFAVGEVRDEFVAALTELCRNAVHRTRGFHRCELCSRPEAGTPPQPTVAGLDNEDFAVGSAEIRVRDRDVVWAAPDMVIHYVLAHRYRPPDAFVDAVMSAAETDIL